jgi:hypothetical protein
MQPTNFIELKQGVRRPDDWERWFGCWFLKITSWTTDSNGKSCGTQ